MRNGPWMWLRVGRVLGVLFFFFSSGPQWAVDFGCGWELAECWVFSFFFSGPQWAVDLGCGWELAECWVFSFSEAAHFTDVKVLLHYAMPMVRRVRELCWDKWRRRNTPETVELRNISNNTINNNNSSSSNNNNTTSVQPLLIFLQYVVGSEI